jgi:hypothetical protein
MWWKKVAWGCIAAAAQGLSTQNYCSISLDVKEIISGLVKYNKPHIADGTPKSTAKVGVLRDSHYLFSTPYREFQ